MPRGRVNGVKVPKVRTPRGRYLTPRQYAALVNGMREPHPCEHGHFDCALWDGGPCADELLTQVEAAEGKPEGD